MNNLLIRGIVIWILIVPSFFHAQTKNAISIQTGIVHCFFDGSPLMNIKYRTKTEKPFHGVLINSLGVEYTRKIKEEIGLSFGAMYFYEGYRSTIFEKKIRAINRGFMTFNIALSKQQALTKSSNFVYGTGLVYRHGYEYIGVAYGEIAPGVNEVIVETCNRDDIGLNGFIGYEYKPIKNISLFSRVDLIGFVYVNDKEAHERLSKFLNMNNYPSRFDLSLKLGVSLNF